MIDLIMLATGAAGVASLAYGLYCAWRDRETAHGNRRVVDYHVELIEADPVPAALPARGMEAMNAVLAQLPQRHGPQSVEKDYSAELAASIAATQPKAATAQTDVLTLTGIEAINAVLAVEQYAKSRGLASFEFGADNIQKVWISLYIDQARGGRR